MHGVAEELLPDQLHPVPVRREQWERWGPQRVVVEGTEGNRLLVSLGVASEAKPAMRLHHQREAAVVGTRGREAEDGASNSSSQSWINLTWFNLPLELGI